MTDLEKPSTSKVLSDLEKPSTSQGGKNQNDGENSNKSGIKKRKVTGIVLWYNRKQGYGFITRDDNKENVYVHGTAIIMPKRARKLGLYKGELVEFDIISKDNVFEASNVSGQKGPKTTRTKVTIAPAILDQNDEKIQKETGENSTKSEMKNRKVTGIVKWFNRKKGFGFITRNDTKEDVYVQAVAIISQPPYIYEGDLVKFDVIPRNNASKLEHNEASNVSALESLLDSTKVTMASETTLSNSNLPVSTVWRSQEFSDRFGIKQTRNISRSKESTSKVSKTAKIAEDDGSDPVRIKCLVESCKHENEFSSMDQFKKHSIKQHFFDQLKNDLEAIDQECLSSLNCPLCQQSPPLVNLNSLIWHFGFKHEKVLKYTKSIGNIIEHKEINESDHRNSAPPSTTITSTPKSTTIPVTSPSKATTSKTLTLTTGTITSTTTTIIPITTSILTPSQNVASRLPTSSSVTSTSTTPTIATREVIQVCLFVHIHMHTNPLVGRQ